MAVSKVKKLELVAHAQYREKVLRILRGLGSVHISDSRQLFPEDGIESPTFLQASLSQSESKLEKVQYCLEFLRRFISKPSFAATLLKMKPVFTRQESKECVATFDLEKLHKEIASIEQELAQNESQTEKNQALMEDVDYWLRLDYPLELIKDTQATRVSLGICEAREFNSMVDELTEASPEFHTEIVERSRTSVSMVLIYQKSLENVFTPILREHGWHSVRFAGLEGTPNEIITKLREQCSALRERNGHLREHITGELVPLHDKLLLLCDHYSQEVQALKVQHNFLFTSHTFFVSGYVLADQEENLRKRLDESARVVDIKLSEPGPDDRVPIHLENNKLVRPFSLITELYGRPQYTEFDPTPLLAPFFVLFFAVCLGDAGYGLILAVGSYIALKKFQIYGGARKLLQILFLGGLANIVVGLLTGAIFGIESGNLPGLLRVLVLFSPTEQVMPFLYIAFALGLIQVLFGLSIKMAHNIRHGKTTSALLDQGLWMLFLMALAPIVYKHIFGGEVSEGINSLALTSSKILVVALIFTQGRDTKIIVLRPIVGLLRLYDTVGYFSDVLSYARLMALGLATAYLAIAFNVMAELSLQIPFGIGYVLATFILVFSHMFNLLVNCLGAFVHSLRLQYLEFFSKFFIGGGKAFVPFIEERQHTIVQPYLNETS